MHVHKFKKVMIHMTCHFTESIDTCHNNFLVNTDIDFTKTLLFARLQADILLITSLFHVN